MFEPMMHWRDAAKFTAIVLAQWLFGLSIFVVLAELQGIVHLKTNVLSLSRKIRHFKGH